MVYELINPSDAYTFEAESDETATVIALVCGSGYGACRDGFQAGPFLFGNPDEWCKKTFGATSEELYEKHKPEIGPALTSFRIGKRSDYPSDEAGIDALMDKRRSSINSVGPWARKTGKLLIEKPTKSAAEKSSL